MHDALETLRRGGKPALARALAQLEIRRGADDTAALLDAAFAAPRGVSIGLTGPPGVGKSTLVNALIAEMRRRGLSVGVVAVDPSSSRTGGALLGDRARLSGLDPADEGVFVRSMATRGQLGGIAALAYPAMVLMQAVFDVVLVETVGVGQSEMAIAGLTDALALCIQPASGDSLQFMKAGIMEVPDLAIVTKADLGAPARRAATDLRGALGAGRDSASPLRVLLVSAQSGEGIDTALDAMLHCTKARGDPSGRAGQAARWMRAAILSDFGTVGADTAKPLLQDVSTDRPFRAYRALETRLRCALAGLDFSELLGQLRVRGR